MGRRPPWLLAAAYKAGYFAFNLAMIGLLYGTKASVLFNETTGEVDRGVEFILWATILASWAAYLCVQGSEPGYITPAMVIGGSGAAAQQAGRGSSATSAGATSPAGVGVQVTIEPAVGAVAPADTGHARPAHSHDHHQHDVGEGEGEGDGLDLLSRMRDDEADYDPTRPGELSGAAAQAREGVRECKWCHAHQPARAHHCRACNKCVATFDHHCGWIGTCIGERNRARFYWFLAAQSSALAVAIGLLNTGFVWRRHMGEWVGANIAQLTALVILWLLQLFVFGLWVFHTWLAATNTTTYETATGSKKLWYLAGTEPQDCDLPYSRGLCTNLRLFCCVLDAGCSSCVSCCRRKREPWRPTAWAFPGKVERDSEDWTGNLWSNKYWSCC